MEIDPLSIHDAIPSFVTNKLDDRILVGKTEWKRGSKWVLYKAKH